MKKELNGAAIGLELPGDNGLRLQLDRKKASLESLLDEPLFQNKLYVPLFFFVTPWTLHSELLVLSVFSLNMISVLDSG